MNMNQYLLEGKKNCSYDTFILYLFLKTKKKKKSLIGFLEGDIYASEKKKEVLEGQNILFVLKKLK